MVFSLYQFRFLTFFLISLPSLLGAQNIAYSSLEISEELKQDVNAVIRKDMTDVKIQSDNDMLVDRKKIITILNSKGDNYGDFMVEYNDFYKVKKIKINIYDALGRKIKSVKSKEIKDYSASDGFSLYNDNRILFYRYIPKNYPYTIEMSYQIRTSNTAFIPRYFPINNYYLSVESSSYTISFPNEMKLFYHEKKLEAFNVKKQASDHMMSYWLEQAKSIKREPYAPPFSEIIANVDFSVNKFSLAGIKGKASSWKELGDWMINNLLKGRKKLGEKTKREILNLVKGANNDIEKARRIYQYMQQKTRYVSVQIGVGGWRPIPANEVDEKGYGDCKALVNYTKSLLDVAGVPSYYTIVYAGDRKDIDKNIVGIQGSHAILALPSQKDTIWLECTNQKIPFSYIGGFTDDRDVLIVKENDSKISRTKKYNDFDNLVETTGQINLLDDKGLDANVYIKSYGKAYDWKYEKAYLNKKEKEDYYKQRFSDLMNLHLEEVGFENDKTNIFFIEKLKFSADNYFKKLEGKEYVLRPNVLNVFSDVPRRNPKRTQPLYIEEGFLEKAELKIILPPKYIFSYFPKDTIINSKFGTYKVAYNKVSDSEINFRRYFLLKEGLYPKEDYDDFLQFLKDVNRQDVKKSIILKNN